MPNQKPSEMTKINQSKRASMNSMWNSSLNFFFHTFMMKSQNYSWNDWVLIGEARRVFRLRKQWSCGNQKDWIFWSKMQNNFDFFKTLSISDQQFGNWNSAVEFWRKNPNLSKVRIATLLFLFSDYSPSASRKWILMISRSVSWEGGSFDTWIHWPQHFHRNKRFYSKNTK